MILSQHVKAHGSEYEVVRFDSFSRDAQVLRVHCHGVYLDPGSLRDRTSVQRVEESLKSPDSCSQQDANDDDEEEEEEEEEDTTYDDEDDDPPTLKDTSTLYTVCLYNNVATFGTPTPTLAMPPSLYAQVTVPDLIARLWDGSCEVCSGERYICPGCTGGIAQRYDAFMSCGVDLACPLCMGIEFMLKDKEYLQKYVHHEAPSEEKEARDGRIDDRLRELGYDEVLWEEDDEL